MAELDRSLGSLELVEWMAYWEIEPFGAIRDNLHSAQLASLMYNSSRGKRDKPLGASDFMFKDIEKQRQDNTQEFFVGLRALAKPKVH